MAAQDLIISRRGSPSSSTFLDPDAPGADGPDGATILFAMFRKRWILLAVIAAASSGLAFLASMQFGKSTATVKSALIYTGLPTGMIQSANEPLGPSTGAEMITQVRVLNKLIDRRGLEQSPSNLAQRIQTTVGRSSSLLNLSLSWSDATEGVAILNELMDIFIEDMASQRKAIQRDHLQHLEMSLLQANARLDEAREHLNTLSKQQQKQLDKGGVTTEKYRSALASVVNAESGIGNKKTEYVGAQQQIQALTQLIVDTDKRQQDYENDLKHDFLRETSDVLKVVRERYTPSSGAGRQVGETIARIEQFAKSDEAQSFDRWQKGLAKILETKSAGLSDADIKRLDESFKRLQSESSSKFSQVGSERQKWEDQRTQLQLRLIPMKNEIAFLEQRRIDYKKQADALSEQITGISANQLDQSKSEADEAEKRQNSLAVQRDSLRQLADSRLREWAVSVPASPETAEIGSNSTKLFVLVFAFCCFAFSAPLLVAEWHTQTGSPQVQFARKLRMPVLAERILDDFSPQQRRAKAGARLEAEQTEMLRMLTLRIQQSCHRPGSVVLFSSLDCNFSAAPLMATVAECLADREERVLLIDAVSPDRSLLPVLNVSTNDNGASPVKGTQGQPAKLAAVHDSKRAVGPGLSEYLSEECEDLGDLIRPTGCPGVDLISSGRVGFAREAMASSCLTQLLSTCRKNYTMVLVHGPAVDCTADLQMLTARADGIVLAATKSIGKNGRVREIVQELMDLGAPIIGLVA